MADRSDVQINEARPRAGQNESGSTPGNVVPPYDIGAEQSLLGSFIVSNTTVD